MTLEQGGPETELQGSPLPTLAGLTQGGGGESQGLAPPPAAQEA